MYGFKASGSMTFRQRISIVLRKVGKEVVDNNCNSQILQIFIVENKDDFENTNKLLIY